MKACPKCGKEYADATTLCPSDGAVLRQTTDLLIGQTLAGKYRIEELISEGGMGSVYRGTHVLMDKKVAIKVLRSSLAADDTIVARFSREAKAASRIAHPHALSVTDFGESENGIVFLVMEYLDGETLKNVIRKEGPMPLDRVVEIMRQVGGALDAAHAEQVIHRDLKSDNIMLMEANGGDWAKVLDFGIAKIQERVGGYDPGITAPNLIIGTPQYMSPTVFAVIRARFSFRYLFVGSDSVRDADRARAFHRRVADRDHDEASAGEAAISVGGAGRYTGQRRSGGSADAGEESGPSLSECGRIGRCVNQSGGRSSSGPDQQISRKD